MSGICSAHQGHDPECPRCTGPQIERKQRRDQWDSEPYLDPDWAIDAAYLYNSVRTILEDSGWTMQKGEFRGWTHPDHCGSHSLGAAHGQWRLDVEHAKYERNRSDPWTYYFEQSKVSELGGWVCRKHGYLIENDEGDQGLCPSCVRYAHNMALDHGFNQAMPTVEENHRKNFTPDGGRGRCGHCNKTVRAHGPSNECPE